MFGRYHTLKRLAGGIAITASIAVVAVPSALSSTSSRSGLVTDTLGGNGSAKALPDAIDRFVATHGARPTQVQGVRFITDTLGGNGQAAAGSVTGFNWGDAGVGAGLAAGLLLLLLVGTRLRTHKRGPLTA